MGSSDFLDENIIITVSALLNNIEGPGFSKGLKAKGAPNEVADNLVKQAIKIIKSS